MVGRQSRDLQAMKEAENERLGMEGTKCALKFIQLAKMIPQRKQSQYHVHCTTRPLQALPLGNLRTLSGACVLLKFGLTLKMDSSGKVNG